MIVEVLLQSTSGIAYVPPMGAFNAKRSMGVLYRDGSVRASTVAQVLDVIDKGVSRRRVGSVDMVNLKGDRFVVCFENTVDSIETILEQRRAAA